MFKRIKVKALGLAFGLTWAGVIFLLGLTASFGYGVDFVEFISRLNIGYGPTLVGSIIGSLWAFVEAFICGAVVAWIYNKFLY